MEKQTLAFNFILEITQAENDHNVFCVSNYDMGNYLIEQSLGLLVMSVDSLGQLEWGTFKWEDKYIIALAAKSLATANTAHKLLFHGNYSEAIVIVRMLFESWLRMSFLAIKPEASSRLEGQNFKVGNIPQELGFNVKHIYKILSYPAHGDKIRVLHDLVEHSQGHIPGFRIGIHLDKQHINLLITQIIFNCWVAAQILNSRFGQNGKFFPLTDKEIEAKKEVEDFLCHPNSGQGLLEAVSEVKKCLSFIENKNPTNPFVLS